MASSFAVEAAEIVGLLGPNGAGKTTSFRMTCGMIEPDAGAGHSQRHRRDPLAHVSPRQGRRHGLSGPGIERVSQALGRAEPARRDGAAQHGPRRRAGGAATSCWSNSASPSCEKSKAGTLSGGERRRLEIARCLVTDPEIILLDEPFTGIDPVTIESIQKIIRDLRSRGISILITDHQVRETLQITDRSYVVVKGQVLVHGTPQEVTNHPKARELYFGTGIEADLRRSA